MPATERSLPTARTRCRQPRRILTALGLQLVGALLCGASGDAGPISTAWMWVAGALLGALLLDGVLSLLIIRRWRRLDHTAADASQAEVASQLRTLRGQLEAAKVENAALCRLNRMQNEFVAVASHELKTPLTSLSAYTEVLLDNADRADFPQRQEFLEIIKIETERLLRMIGRLLDYSRLEFGEKHLDWQIVPVAPLLGETTRSLQPLLDQKQLSLSVSCSEDLPRVEVDCDLIRQVMVNLLNNAIKYTEPGGTIHVCAVEDAATLRISVQDNGTGIPAEELRKIFRQFYRVDGTAALQEGVGLGLSIVKNIIDLHSGHIDVQSRVGAGATFSFHLPKEHHFNPRRAKLLGDLMPNSVFQQILRLSVRMVAEMMEARTVALLLLQEDKDELAIQSALGLPADHVANFSVPRSHELVADLLDSGQPRLGWITGEGDPLQPAVSAAGPVAEVASWRAAVPLPLGEPAVGLIAVGGKVDGKPFTADDLYLLMDLSEKVATGLARARTCSATVTDMQLIVQALQTLVMMKRSGVPTATPLALRLLTRTAVRLGLSSAEAKRLRYVAFLHDAGMMSLDEGILQKDSRLSEDEQDEVGLHPERGVHMMAPLLPAPEMGEIILRHHERMDGTGYPGRRRGGQIPLGARILAVVDAFFAMIQHRPYRAGRPTAEVVDELRLRAGTQFDSQVVETFLHVLREEGIIPASPAGLDSESSEPPTTDPHEEARWQPQGS